MYANGSIHGQGISAGRITCPAEPPSTSAVIKVDNKVDHQKQKPRNLFRLHGFLCDIGAQMRCRNQSSTASAMAAAHIFSMEHNLTEPVPLLLWRRRTS